MVSPMPGKDPGWGRPSAILLGVLLPWHVTRRVGRSGQVLVVLRGAFLSFAFALVMFGVVLVLIGNLGEALIDPTAAAGGVLAYGLVTYVVAGRIKARLPCGSIGELVGAYRTRFFLRIAFADAAALIGFVLTFQSGSLLPYAAGLIPAALGFIRVAPTRGNLQREQDAMRADGCPFGLYDLLCETTLGGGASAP
jgi:hypothetical protein